MKTFAQCHGAGDGESGPEPGAYTLNDPSFPEHLHGLRCRCLSHQQANSLHSYYKKTWIRIMKARPYNRTLLLHKPNAFQ